MAKRTVVDEPQHEHDVNRLAGTEADQQASAASPKPSGEELSLICKVKCGAPNNSGPKLGFEVDLNDNAEYLVWDVMREVANGRLKCTLRIVAQDGQTGSLIDKPFSATGDAGQVAYNAAQHVVKFGISFKNGDEGKHAALDFHNRTCRLVLVREGDAGDESPNAHSRGDDADPDQMSLADSSSEAA